MSIQSLISVVAVLIIFPVNEIRTQLSSLKVQDLQNQIKILSETVKTLRSDLTSVHTELHKDITQVWRYIGPIQGNITALKEIAVDHESRISNNENKISTLQSQMNSVTGKIKGLQESNQIWRSNFQVVKKVFGQLSKKVKLEGNTVVVFPTVG